MAISSVGSIPLNQFPLANPLSASGNGSKVKSDPVHDFLEYAQKSPAERLRASILKEMGLTEEELDQMDPETLKQVERPSQRESRKRSRNHRGRPACFSTSLSSSTTSCVFGAS